MFQHTAAGRRLLSQRAPSVWLLLCFNTQPRGGGCRNETLRALSKKRFNTQPRGGGCIYFRLGLLHSPVSTHSRGEAAATSAVTFTTVFMVSTHSRPKAAARHLPSNSPTTPSFNTQPPEGGCQVSSHNRSQYILVSTHSRPKAAAPRPGGCERQRLVSTHSRPKAAAVLFIDCQPLDGVSTHSRPKAAAH